MTRASALIRWRLVTTLAVSGAALQIFSSPAHCQPETDVRPNVLFIVADDLNHWVRHLGRNQQARTPNIDRLAAQGVTFANAYGAASLCNPSRAALLSGQRPGTTAVYGSQERWEKHVAEGLGLPAQFLRAGYYVAGAGKIHHRSTYYPSEWTEYMDSKGFSAHGAGVDKNEGFLTPVRHDLHDEDLGDWKTVDWCIDQLKQPHDKPLFLACGLNKPHLPFAVPRKYYDAFPLDLIELPPYREGDLDDIPSAGIRMAKPERDHAQILESGRWKDVIQSYLATVAYADMNIGRLLDALDNSPLRDNTIIVLLGDNGWHFGEKRHWRKATLWEEGARVPLIWVVPGVTTPGTASTRPVDLMSIYPTLCELASIPCPAHVEGVSILPLLKDAAATWTVPAVTTQGYANHSIRTEAWRYIRYADGSEELYDHELDPYEWKNLASDPKYSAIIGSLARWLPTRNAKPERSSKTHTRVYLLVALVMLAGASAYWLWRRRAN